MVGTVNGGNFEWAKRYAVEGVAPGMTIVS
jgi:hypothetical protein